MILAIDAGNTRTKWGVFDAQGAMQSHGAWLNTELLQYENIIATIPPEWQACKQAVISNVAGTRLATVIKAKLAQLNISQRWVVPTKQAANLLNSYEQPEKLGSDRWLALIAATHEYAVACVVINAGTALTVDALSVDKNMQGVFLGGLILPGLSLMQNSLLENTANITALETGTWHSFPLNTSSAIYSGALSAMAGAVRSICDKLEQHIGVSPLCVVSGGDGQVLMEHLLVESLIEPQRLIPAENLVLKGLYILENSLTES
jgi:type III pantothenate kinase